MKKSKNFFVAAILFIWILPLLSCKTAEISPDIPGRSEPILVDHARIVLKEANLRNSLQTYYLMQYPDSGNTFLEVILSIDEFAASPEVIQNWGIENILLECENSQPDLFTARRVIVSDEVLYEYGEELEFDYVYFFNVSKNTDFDTCVLAFSDGQRISLAPLSQPQEIVLAEVGESGAVLSGRDNQARGQDAVVAGGSRNTASAIHTAVAGGDLNSATASHATVSGGRENSANDFYATISGGYANTANARDTFIGGGSRNIVSAPRAVVGGGLQNQAEAPDTTIAGGAYNQAGDDYAAITGGTRNTADGFGSFVGGGAGHTAAGDQSAVVGGLNNQVHGSYGFIGGGYGNWVSGNYAVIPGGFQNQAEGDYSFAAGNRAQVPVDHGGSFVFADATVADFPALAANEFAVRATGGVRFVSAVDGEGQVIAGVQLPAGGGAWSTLSDRQAKSDFDIVDPQIILEALNNLSISTWRYRGQNVSVRHIGPMAQDFFAVFDVGEDPRYISTVDADGVALAAIQGLSQLVQEQETQIQEQGVRLVELESRLQVLEQTSQAQQKSQPVIWHGLGWLLVLGIGSGYVREKLSNYHSGLSKRNP